MAKDDFPIKMRAQYKNGLTELKILMSHPMETGRRKNDAGELVPAHFIQVVEVFLNNTKLLETHWGTGISKNPYLTLTMTAAKPNDTVRVEWHDNQGIRSQAEIKVIIAK